MDVLSDVLGAIRLCGSAFFTAELSAPWALESPSPDFLGAVALPEAEHVSFLHILIDGSCFIECAAHARLDMHSGDLVLFPHGDSHVMHSERSAPPLRLHDVISRPAPDALPHVTFGGGGQRARFVCSYLNCNQRFAPLFEALPPMLVARRGAGYAEIESIGGHESAVLPRATRMWLGSTLDLAVNEALAGRPGNAAMLGRLTELMFVEIVREYMHRLDSRQRGWRERGWVAALNDPYVGKALQLLHAEPTRPWTVDGLAHEVATSRSALAQRFTATIGESPMRYLTGWRMQLARQMLRDRGDSVRSIAERIGYQSEYAFNRAFKRATGCPPAAWRRTAAHRLSEE